MKDAARKNMRHSRMISKEEAAFYQQELTEKKQKKSKLTSMNSFFVNKPRKESTV